MAKFTTEKSTISLAGITGYGARLKAVVERIVSVCDGLEIHETYADDANNYSVGLSFEGETNWLIQINNSSTSIYFHYVTPNSDGTYTSKSNVYLSSILNSDNIYLEANQSGTDMLVMGVHVGGNLLDLLVYKIVDQFTGAEGFCVGVGSVYGAYYAASNYYITDGTNVVTCYADKNANGLAPHDIAVAVPVVFYTDSAAFPLSGFVAGGTLLYHIYQGTKQLTCDTRLTNLTVGEHSFVSLGNNLFAKTN